MAQVSALSSILRAQQAFALPNLHRIDNIRKPTPERI